MLQVTKSVPNPPPPPLAQSKMKMQGRLLKTYYEG